MTGVRDPAGGYNAGLDARLCSRDSIPSIQGGMCMRFNVQLSVAVTSVCLLLAGCGQSPPVPQAAMTPHAVVAFPTTVQLAAGSSAQLQAQVNDMNDQPIGGASIVFRSQNPDIIGVSQDGVVSALGPVGVAAVQIASGVRVVEVPVRIVAGAGAVLEATQAPAATAQAGTPLGNVTVQLRDQFNNPVPGAALSWKPDDLGGLIEFASVTTAADGTGTARWTAATSTGAHTLEVRSGDLPPLVLNTSIIPGPPVAIQLRSDPLQIGASATVGDTLQIQAQVVDQYGNGVAGVELALDASGACTAKATLQQTDDDGTTPASSWEIGDRGSCVVIAKTTQPPTLEARINVPAIAAAKRK